MKKYQKLIFLLFFALLFSFGCSGPEPDREPSAGPDPSGAYSVALESKIEGGGILLSWKNPVEISGFRIYRKTGTSSFVALDDLHSGSTWYLDKTTPLNQEVSYYITFYSQAEEFDSRVSAVLKISPVALELYPVGDKVHLYWAAQTGGDEIQIFRTIDSGTGVLVGSVPGDVNFFEDSNPVHGVEHKYFLVINYSNGTSITTEYSASVKVTDFSVLNLLASKLKYTDRIVVSWYPVENADSYNVYRYTSLVDSSPVVFSTSVNSFSDMTGDSRGPVVDTPYFYKVACIIGGVESSVSSNYAFGICSTVPDSFESNDLYNPPVNDDAGNLIPGTEEYAVIYSFADGSGSYVEDVDWYKYRGEASPVTLTLTFPANSSLIGNVSLFQYQGAEFTLDSRINTFQLEFTGELIFKVEFNTAGNDGVLGSYRVLID